MRTVSRILAAAALIGAAGPVLAQTGATRNATVPAGKSVRVGVVTALKKDCSIGQLGTIRVVSPPKMGQFEVRGGKAKTPASFRCPNVETPIQELLYQAKPGSTGADEISYEARNAEGGTELFTVKITVSNRPGGSQQKSGILDL